MYRHEDRCVRHDVIPERPSIWNYPLAFFLGQRVGTFERERVGSNQVVSGIAVIVTESSRLIGVRFDQDPTQGHTGIQDLSHSSRVSRIMSTAQFTTPWFSNICCWTASDRSRMRRLNSGS